MMISILFLQWSSKGNVQKPGIYEAAKDFRDTKISQHSEGVGKEKTMGMDLEGEN